MKRVMSWAIGVAAAGLVGSTSVQAQSLGLEGLHDQRAEGGRICFTDHFHYGTGSGPTKQVAEREAVASWSGFTAFEYGDRWGSWRLAASKKLSCSQSGGSWSCNAEARPCRPGGLGGGSRRARTK